MIYKAYTLKKDDDLLKGVNLSQLAKLIPCTRAYLSQVKNNRIICTELFRSKIVKAIMATKQS